jgi:hypothetical protein
VHDILGVEHPEDVTAAHTGGERRVERGRLVPVVVVDHGVDPGRVDLGETPGDARGLGIVGPGDDDDVEVVVVTLEHLLHGVLDHVLPFVPDREHQGDRQATPALRPFEGGGLKHLRRTPRVHHPPQRYRSDAEQDDRNDEYCCSKHYSAPPLGPGRRQNFLSDVACLRFVVAGYFPQYHLMWQSEVIRDLAARQVQKPEDPPV